LKNIKWSAATMKCCRLITRQLVGKSNRYISSYVRAIENLPSSIILIKIHLKMPKLCLFKSLRLTMFLQTRIKELGMILIEKKFYLIKNKWPNRIWKCTASDLIFGPIIRSVVLRTIAINKVDFSKFIDRFFKRLKLNRQKPSKLETT
jgi:hypothetical protein